MHIPKRVGNTTPEVIQTHNSGTQITNLISLHDERLILLSRPVVCNSFVVVHSRLIVVTTVCDHPVIHALHRCPSIFSRQFIIISLYIPVEALAIPGRLVITPLSVTDVVLVGTMQPVIKYHLSNNAASLLNKLEG